MSGQLQVGTSGPPVWAQEDVNFYDEFCNALLGKKGVFFYQLLHNAK